MLHKSLLACGIVAMLWYVAINIFVPMQYPGYDIASYTVSELSAIGAPTRTLWFILCIFYSLFFIAFGAGVWLSANGNRKLQIVAAVIIFDSALGFFGPPMHQRQIIAAGGGTFTDTLHLVWAFIHLTFMLLMIGFGAAAFGKSFRLFSVMIVCLTNPIFPWSSSASDFLTPINLKFPSRGRSKTFISTLTLSSSSLVI